MTVVSYFLAPVSSPQQRPSISVMDMLAKTNETRRDEKACYASCSMAGEPTILYYCLTSQRQNQNGNACRRQDTHAADLHVIWRCFREDALSLVRGKWDAWLHEFVDSTPSAGAYLI
jgi:hypothetical protein